MPRPLLFVRRWSVVDDDDFVEYRSLVLEPQQALQGIAEHLAAVIGRDDDANQG